MAMPLQLEDVAYQFDQPKLSHAPDVEAFFGSFVDYYYLLMQKNKVQFKSLDKAWNSAGWCVGDAHAENFGVLLLKKGSALFTMNDMDDAGPCPVVLDFVRLLISARFYDSQIDLTDPLLSYAQGLRGQIREAPSVLQTFIQKAQALGMGPSAKKVIGNKIVRNATSIEVSSAQFDVVNLAISTLLKSTVSQPLQVLDMIATHKVGGGSDGLLRYEVLINNQGSLLHIELKTEVQPSVYPVATSLIPDTVARIMHTLQVEQGIDVSPFYGVVDIDNQAMLVRPRFAGNVGFSLMKFSNLKNKEIISYESYLLGRIHARSLSDPMAMALNIENLPSQDFENEVTAVTHHFQKKLKELLIKQP
jgi:uncharacterized protein (DUF2252 family)